MKKIGTENTFTVMVVNGNADNRLTCLGLGMGKEEKGRRDGGKEGTEEGL